MTPQRVIGVDLGGTKIAAGLVDRDGGIAERCELPTPVSSQDDLLSGLDAAIAELMGDEVGAIGIGVPCPVDALTGVPEAAARRR